MGPKRFPPSEAGAALAVHVERWPLAEPFVIARGAKSEAQVVVAELTRGSHRGRGEAVPYARYGETVEAVSATLAGLAPALADGLGRTGLQTALPPGAARNALDCAFWDLEAKEAGRPAWALAGLAEPGPVTTAFTLSLAAPAAMAAAARRAGPRPLLKLKLGATDVAATVEAVREAAPGAALIVDANEAWDETLLMGALPQLAALGVELIEQPLPAGRDGALDGLSSPIPLCADESALGGVALATLARRYHTINIKLDRVGGLTAALALAAAARAQGLEIMVGCIVATSLAMAPAFLLTGQARYVDLDGPLLLARDRPAGFRYEGSLMLPCSPELWG